jgi:hypothetical protein
MLCDSMENQDALLQHAAGHVRLHRNTGSKTHADTRSLNRSQD